MSIIYKGYLIAAETFAVISIILLLFVTVDRNMEYEKAVNDSVDKKINISSTYGDYENEDNYMDPNSSNNLLYLTGSAVITELLTYDGSITVTVDSRVLNNYRTDTREPFFQYVKKYGLPYEIANQISVTRQYKKTCITDQAGKLVKVEYVMQ